ncbi:uncharacterized protein LOC118810835 [Colossoma macropomum]|uniref:uncharacterized protein LOC118810835 n=1 Tax=Colossoma macropomum TaxID=42526 RepID=UPI0018647446|nr:uncharacterized protein LOC118810835 [Colossoma macropomum]
MAGWLETKGGHTFAICEVQSLPEASILWEPLSNSSLPETNSSREASGIFIVTSRLQLPRNAFDKNLTCVAASHSKWPETRFTIFTGNETFKWPSVLLGVYASWAIIKLVTSLYIIHRNRGQFRKICCTSKTPTEEKNPQSCVYEEVELHVKSICSSSEAPSGSEHTPPPMTPVMSTLLRCSLCHFWEKTLTMQIPVPPPHFIDALHGYHKKFPFKGYCGNPPPSLAVFLSLPFSSSFAPARSSGPAFLLLPALTADHWGPVDGGMPQSHQREKDRKFQ